MDDLLHEQVEGLDDIPEESDYQSKRSDAYPPIKEQLDMIYKDLSNGTTTFVDFIGSIKQQFPKE